jgi:hypothetical protein
VRKLPRPKSSAADGLGIEVLIFIGILLWLCFAVGCQAPAKKQPSAQAECVRVLHGERSYTPQEWHQRCHESK